MPARIRMNDAAAPKLGDLAADAAIFLIGAALQYGVVTHAVPVLGETGLEPLAAWMILSIPLIFVPIIALGLLILRAEGHSRSLSQRLWLARPSPEDWRWAALGLLAMGLGSGAMFALCAALGLDSLPPFARHAKPWTDERIWMLGLWLVYWPINILGENLVWRGIVLPRMEARLGRWAWLVNAFAWGIFHLAFGVGNLIVLLPTLLVVPYVAQRRRSTWLAVVLHAGLSGPGFAALALGMV